MNKNFVIVSFYTPEYSIEAIKLLDSLERYSLFYDIQRVDSKKSWIENVNYKSQFCKEMLDYYYDIPVVWVDCDAEVQHYPELFHRIDADIGVYFRNRYGASHELLSGTIYFGNTAVSKDIVAKWCDFCKRNPTRWDQRSLQEVLELEKERVRIFEIPPSYVRIFDAHDMQGIDPVILHNQASRRLKRIVNATR